jgi:hypothetical protein
MSILQYLNERSTDSTYVKTKKKNYVDFSKKPQEAYSEDLTLKKLFTLDTAIEVEEGQRNLIPKGITDSCSFGVAQSIAHGTRHSNVVLIDVEKCYEATNDHRWLKFKTLEGKFKFLILDGAHSITNLSKAPKLGFIRIEDTDKYKNRTLPVRIITYMEYDEIGRTFIVNNLNNQVGKQDLLHFMNTDMSRYVAKLSNEFSIPIFNKIYGPANANRTNDNRIRMAIQYFIGIGKEAYDTSLSVGEKFYNDTKPSEELDFMMEQYLGFILIMVRSVDKNQKLKRMLTFLAPYMLKNFLSKYEFTKEGIKEIYNQFQAQHIKNLKEELQVPYVEGTILTIPYKEACQDKGKTFSTIKSLYWRKWVEKNLSDWTSKNYLKLRNNI